MSPQFKRVALVCFAITLTGLLVLSAIAVAQRDARNVSDVDIVREPSYAQQAIEPMAMPSTSASDRATQPTRSIGFPETGLTLAPSIRDFKIPPIEGHASVAPVRAESKTAILPIAMQSNPLRNLEQFDTQPLEESDSFEEATASISVRATARSTLETGAAVSQAAWQTEPVDSDFESESDVIPVVGYGLPTQTPSGNNQAASASQPPNLPTSDHALMVPPLPVFGNASTNLPSLSAPTRTVSTATQSSTTNATTSSTLPPALPATGGFNATQPKVPSQLAADVGPNFASAGLPSLPNFPATDAPSSSSSNPLTPPQSDFTDSRNLPPPPALSRATLPAMPRSQTSQLVNDFPASESAAMSSRMPDAPTSPTVPFANQSSANQPPRDIGIANRPQVVSSDRAIAANLTSVRPGERALDGTQVPSLQIQKLAPQEIQVGHPATFTILVKNVGTIAATSVSVQDALPDGTKLIATNPPAEVLANNRLLWSLGDLPAGGQQVLTLELVPEIEGEIGSVATVHFAAQASVRTVSTQPKLTINQRIDPSVLIGETAKLRVTVTNEGSGVAYDVSLEEDIPVGFRHQHGEHLGLQLNDLSPGQSRTVDLEMQATDAGLRQNTIRLLASNAEPITSTVDIEVVSPKLALGIEGPKLRYLERQATYKLSVNNNGTATARNVELMAYLPRGLQFNAAGNHGEYIASQHAVVWSLEELSAKATATTDLVLMPVEEGDFVIRLQSRADRVTSEPFEKQVRIEGQSELSFTVEDDNDPIEVDGETTYAVRISNIGTRGDSNVQVVAELPRGAVLQAVSAPVEYKVQGDQLVFAPIPNLKSKDQQLIRFSVRLNGEGTQMLRVAVKSDLRPVAVVKEESTQVYSDF